MSDQEVSSLSLLQAILLSIFPGFLILVFYLLIGRHAKQLGIPSILVIYAAIPLILVPFELGYLLYEGKKINNRLSLNNVVLFKEKVPVVQFMVLVLTLLAWSGVVFSFFAPKIDTYFINKFFYWIPKWFFIEGLLSSIHQYSRTMLLVTWGIGFVFNGFIGPIVEELYFRGYLLPRQNNIKGWAPLINVVLFSLYHLFTPWQNLTRIIALIPFVYAVWWKRNIYIGIIAHCMLNTIGLIGMLPLILK